MRTSPVINKLNYRPWIKGSDLGSDGLAALAAAAAGEAGDEADQEEASDAEPQHRELADQVRGVLLSLAGECSVQPTDQIGIAIYCLELETNPREKSSAGTFSVIVNLRESSFPVLQLTCQ